MDIVDAVINLFTPQEVDEGRTGLDATFMDQIRMDPEIRGGVPLSDYLAKMDRAGIDQSLLLAARGGDMRIRGSFEVPYERVHQACASSGGRLFGLAGIDPSRGMAGVRELEIAVREYGFVGAHLYPHWFELAPDHARYYPYYAKCCELDIPVMIQVGHNLIYNKERRLPSVGRPISLDPVAIDFPELRIIGIHIGVPWTDEMISMAWKHENVFISTCAYRPRYWPPQLLHYLSSYGRTKVLFGTDWPVLDPERVVKEVAALDIRPESRALFMSGNARRIFRLPDRRN